MRQLWTMTASDLRLRVRDGSVLIFGVAVPLALMFVMQLTLGDAQEGDLAPVTVAASAPEDDELAQALVGALGETGFLDVTVDRVPAGQVRDRAESGDAGLGIVVPPGFGAGVRDAEQVTVDVIEGDGAGLETDILISVLRAVLDRFTAGTEAATAGARAGVDPDRLAEVARQAAAEAPQVRLAEGEAASEQLGVGGSLVAGQAGLFLLFTVGFGVLALVVEREQGTLARLRSMPMPAWWIVAAKALASYVLGVLATTVLLVAGSLLFDVSFGSPWLAGVVVLSAVAAGTSLMFLVARVARTAEQANIAQSILAIGLGMAGGAFFTVTADGWFGRVLDLNPVAAFIRGLGVTAGGGGLTDLAGPVLTMLGFAVLCVAASRLLPDRGTSL